MPHLNFYISDRLRRRKEALPITWEEALRVGVDVIESAVCNADFKALSPEDQRERLHGLTGGDKS